MNNKEDSFSEYLKIESFFLLIKPEDNIYSNTSIRNSFFEELGTLVKLGLKNFEISWSNNEKWSNFDGWESISVQQWIFSRALEVYKGMKIDIKCDCCEYNNDLIPNDFESIKKEKCYGIKSAFMIKKVVDEIVLANAKRESDGTYFA